MARLARGEFLDPQTIQIAHAHSRCVRRSFLCGVDTYSGQSYEHRRQWIRDRLEFQASVFAIDCLTFAIMGNHLHLVLRNRPDIVQTWTDREVATRWLRLCPPRNNGRVVQPTEGDINMIINDQQKLAKLRIRLSDISWWMRLMSQKIAQQANKEDDCTGHFWEGRFKAQPLLDEAAVLACAMYVDLNPIRAAMAQSLEDSDFTGSKERVDDLKESRIPSTEEDVSERKVKPASFRTDSKLRRIPIHQWERSASPQRSGWLSPIEIDESRDPIGPDPSRCGRRASLRGFLSMPLARYLELLDWTGRQFRSDKRGSIPDHITPILERLGIKPKRWLELAMEFGRLFKRAAGHAVSLAGEAKRRGQLWLQAPGVRCLE